MLHRQIIPSHPWSYGRKADANSLLSRTRVHIVKGSMLCYTLAVVINDVDTRFHKSVSLIAINLY